eukprot:TRINITY_DN4533_c1_g1_i1.p1 TRINITY_DN4533_c1_g1~~TRINITY_DN4533_c1_g1_i1.p1  ORF type:complete len:140 (+),score=19.86 TRINITY_DN4533_c1_g1_i1:102-521(+)
MNETAATVTVVLNGHDPRDEETIFEREWEIFLIGGSAVCLVILVIVIMKGFAKIRSTKPGAMNFKAFGEQLHQLDYEAKDAMLLEEGNNAAEYKPLPMNKSAVSLVTSDSETEINKSEESILHLTKKRAPQKNPSRSRR